MKKIALLFMGATLLAACKQAASPAPQTEQQAEGEMMELQKAMESGQPVKCTMTKTDGSQTMQYMMKGKKVKVSGITTGVGEQNYQGMMISDGSYMYTWDEIKKEGVKFQVPSEEDVKNITEKTGQDIPNLSNDSDRQRWEDQGYRISCAPGSVDDSEFVPPTDVKFTDASAMMESVNKMMEQGSSGEAPTEQQQKTMEEQAKELMKQYGQQ